MLVELFPAKVRCLGVALSHNMSMMALGGTTLTVCMGLIQQSAPILGVKGSLLMPGVYIMCAAFASFLGVLKMKESYRKVID